MDIEELSDAVKRWNEWVEPPLVLEWMEPLVEAARMWLNPNIEAAVKPLIDYLTPRQSEGVGRNTELYREVARLAVAAVLTPQGDTDE